MTSDHIILYVHQTTGKTLSLGEFMKILINELLNIVESFLSSNNEHEKTSTREEKKKETSKQYLQE
ncbi:CLUMA_CG000576, isoform A [Clunio marinus]|uniref:CLUMA_CG000576, isoform A n=1 Tax=Clunio marinus TaxID=568069 RepID=A0A1J1HFJ7_9DIPT|nr:CLUMA_CG000576, isoform A [Clunio marinus]